MLNESKALIILFGATGDLAAKKLYPALYQLYSKKYLSDNFAVIGTARREWSDEYFQEVVTEAIGEQASSAEHAKEFARHFYYQSHNVNDTDHYHKLRNLADELDEKHSIGGNRVFYLSMAPSLFGVITQHLHTENLVTDNGFNRVIIEKPFGFDYESSKKLNDEISETFHSDQIYRIDHYLGKEMVQNILALRFSNPLFANIWNNSTISNIQITLSENFGVGERGGYYDNSGALKDMVQNHVLQIFSLLAMDAPKEFTPKEISKEKVAVLENLKFLDSETIEAAVIRAQYTAASGNTGEVSYRQEEQVDENSTTETFVAGKLEVRNDVWAGVPFYYRTGKQMTDKMTRIDIVFGGNSKGLFNEDHAKPNVLTIHLGPEEGITLTLNQKEIGHQMKIQPTLLENLRSESEKKETPEAYEKLILDVLNGNSSHFAHYKEVAASWKYVDHIAEIWQTDASDLKFYEIGTKGPTEASELLSQNGHKWVWNGDS